MASQPSRFHEATQSTHGHSREQSPAVCDAIQSFLRRFLLKHLLRRSRQVGSPCPQSCLLAQRNSSCSRCEIPQFVLPQLLDFSFLVPSLTQQPSLFCFPGQPTRYKGYSQAVGSWCRLVSVTQRPHCFPYPGCLSRCILFDSFIAAI